MFTYTVQKHVNMQDLDKIFLFLLSRKDINKKTLFKRLATIQLFCMCKEWDTLVWFWSLKQPSKEILVHLPLSFTQTYNKYLESWFFYVHPSSRWLGIAAIIQNKLIKKGPSDTTIISVTKIDNIPMQKTLLHWWFVFTWISYLNNFLQKQVQLYIYTNIS